MNKSLKVVVIVASSMLAAGLLLAGIGFALGGNKPIYCDQNGIYVGNEGKAGSGKIETSSEKINSFTSIKIDVDYYEIYLIPSDKYAIDTTYNNEYGKPTYKIENGELSVKLENQDKFPIDFGLSGLTKVKNNLKIKIYYPKGTELKNVAIYADAADISLDGVIADDLTINNDMGKVSLNGGKLKTLKVTADAGDLLITDTSMDQGDIQVDLGRLTANGITSNGLIIVNDSGETNLTGTLLGNTNISCDLGKVMVSPGAAKGEFNCEFKTEMGSISIDGEKVSGDYTVSNSAKNTLKITADMGDIVVDFK